MSQDETPASTATVLYTDSELEKARDVLKNCTFKSESLKEDFSTRIALWIHYCNEHCKGDDRVTESGLDNYVEWMANSGGVTSKGHTLSHYNELFTQMIGAFYYWRIQEDELDDKFNSKWNSLYLKTYTNIYNNSPNLFKTRHNEDIPCAQAPNNTSVDAQL
ncbi:hypothetical protein GGI16_003939 [Coemansia sp. S142-1]|nr:hypothetical protein LPJ71_003804 [Coemansia sp. S17]KAJ2099645.1 hypothetical protein GGI16_003939 [Coemansia sp. S142-1]